MSLGMALCMNAMFILSVFTGAKGSYSMACTTEPPCKRGEGAASFILSVFTGAKRFYSMACTTKPSRLARMREATQDRSCTRCWGVKIGVLRPMKAGAGEGRQL